MQEMQEMQVQSLHREDSLEEGRATHSSILAWRIPWTEDLVGYSLWDHKVLDKTEATEHPTQHSLLWSTQSHNEAETDVFLEFSCIFYDPMDTGILISSSSAFSKSSFVYLVLGSHIVEA